MGMFLNNKGELKNEVALVRENVNSLTEVIDKENKKLNVNLKDVHVKIHNVEKENRDLRLDVDFLKQQLEKVMNVLTKEGLEHEQNKIIQIEADKHTEDGKFSYRKICKIADLSIQETALKYYLCDKGVMEKIINHTRNTFKLANGNDISKYPDYIQKYCTIEKGQLFFYKDFVEYMKENINGIKESNEAFLRKSKEYNDTKKKLEAVSVKNYRKEINRILGIGKDFDPKKWNHVFTVFKSTPIGETFDNGIKEYKEKFEDIQNFEYVCSIMGQGNYFLKIVCELYA